MQSSKKNIAITIISILCSILLLFFIGYGIKNMVGKMIQTKHENAEKETQVAMEQTVSTTTEEPTTVTTEEVSEITNWFATEELLAPTMTEKTISLPKADLSVFEEDNTEIELGPDAETKGAWELVTLNLDCIDGSINLTSPGEPAKTQQLTSTYMVLIDSDTGEIIAERDSDKIIYPASMTKILTVITARDYLTENDLDDTYTITNKIIEDVNIHGLNAVGFSAGDVVTVRDLLYGTIVCSGGDAAYGLANYCAGSEEAFVEKMNENIEKLGLSQTAHFTNPVGNFAEENHCTMRDVAILLNLAMKDDLLKDVLSKRIYTTDAVFPQNVEDDENQTTSSENGETDENVTTEKKEPVPIEISNWFLRRIEDKEYNGNVIGAKTGFVNQSGFCCASYYEANNGKHYICVTGNTYSSWRAIYDHVSIYRSFTE